MLLLNTNITLINYNFIPNLIFSNCVLKDFNQTGVIHYTEFVAATLELHGRVEEKRLAEAFDLMDDDDSGYISKEVSAFAPFGCVTITLCRTIFAHLYN